MNIINISIIVIGAVFAFKGLLKGFILEIFTLIGFVAGYIIALREMNALAGLIEKSIKLPASVLTVISFFLIFILILLLTRALAKVLRKMAEVSMIGWLDKLGGLGFGLFKGLLTASIIIHLLTLFSLPEDFKRLQEEASLYKPVKSIAPFVFDTVRRVLPGSGDFYDEIKESVSRSSKEFKEDVIESGLEKAEEKIKERIEDLSK